MTIPKCYFKACGTNKKKEIYTFFNGSFTCDNKNFHFRISCIAIMPDSSDPNLD